MSALWRIVPPLALRLQCWEEECALYVSPSGTTHIMPRDLGAVLIRLQQSACGEDALRAGTALPATVFAQRLQALAQLGLIETFAA